MKKGKSRTRVARYNIRKMVRARHRAGQAARGQGYDHAAYDGSINSEDA